ncbi:hypothetical protein CPT76_20200 [Paenibacillus sp. AR247]|nr:hypothetical protein CPT76_20200 [Paenibacillus sp. AR247]
MRLKGDRTLRDLLRIGLPMTGSGFIHSIYHAFLPLVITKSLVLAGVGVEMATKQFGMLAGYAIPLLFLPGFFTQSLSTALIPAISEASAEGDTRLMHSRMDMAMRTGLLVGVPCTVILYMWAVPLTTVVYHSPEAGVLLQLLAPLFFLHYFEAPLKAILLGLGKASTVMWNHIMTNIFEISLIFVLGSNLGIRGVALGFGLGILMLTVLNFYAVAGSIGFYFDFRMVIKAGSRGDRHDGDGAGRASFPGAACSAGSDGCAAWGHSCIAARVCHHPAGDPGFAQPAEGADDSGVLREVEFILTAEEWVVYSHMHLSIGSNDAIFLCSLDRWEGAFF